MTEMQTDVTLRSRERAALKITPAEERLYDNMAPIVRLLGMSLHATERAQQLAHEWTQIGRDADNATLHGGESAERDNEGRSPYTAWVESVSDRLARFERDHHRLYQEIAAEALKQSMAMGAYARTHPVG